MELDVIINWIMAASITLIGVYVGWYLNQRSMVKAEERRNKKEQEICINRISQHLVGFTIIVERFKQFMHKKDSIDILKNDLEKWMNELEMIFANFAHLNFMPKLYADSQYLIGRIEYILRESTERDVQESIKKDEIMGNLNDIRAETKKYLNRLGKLLKD